MNVIQITNALIQLREIMLTTVWIIKFPARHSAMEPRNVIMGLLAQYVQMRRVAEKGRLSHPSV